MGKKASASFPDCHDPGLHLHTVCTQAPYCWFLPFTATLMPLLVTLMPKGIHHTLPLYTYTQTHTLTIHTNTYTHYTHITCTYKHTYTVTHTYMYMYTHTHTYIHAFNLITLHPFIQVSIVKPHQIRQNWLRVYLKLFGL